MKLFFALGAVIALVEAGSSDYQIDAKFKGNCDSKGSVYRKDSSSDDWSWLADFDGWEKTLTLKLRDVHPDTRIKVTCQDNGKNVGGFIGQVTVEGTKYYTKGNLEGSPWRSSKVAQDDLVSTHNDGKSPWKSKLPNGVEEIDSNADWIWNGETNNKLTFVFTFAKVVYDAVFKGNCDNAGWLSISNDGERWTELVDKDEWNKWQNTLKHKLHATRQTTLKVECKDKSGNVGGFIGQVNVRGRKYETKKLSNSKWEVTKGANEDDIVYTANGKAPWGDAADSLVDTAAWLWDGNTDNKLTFEFKFDRVLPDYSLAPGWNVDDWWLDMPSQDEPEQAPEHEPMVYQPLVDGKKVPVYRLSYTYYLVMVTCALLIVNVVVIAFSFSKSLCCKGCVAQYSKVDLYDESDVEKDRLNAISVE